MNEWLPLFSLGHHTWWFSLVISSAMAHLSSYGPTSFSLMFPISCLPSWGWGALQILPQQLLNWHGAKSWHPGDPVPSLGCHRPCPAQKAVLMIPFIHSFFKEVLRCPSARACTYRCKAVMLMQTRRALPARRLWPCGPVPFLLLR